MKVKGYICHYNVANMNNEIVDANSFLETLKEREQNNVVTPINFMHEAHNIIGKVTKFYSDMRGLFVEAELFDELDIVKNYVKPLVNNGVIDSFSTEGFIRKADMVTREKGTYYVKNFRLSAVAIVNNPADRDAKFTTNSLSYFDGFENYLISPSNDEIYTNKAVLIC